MVIRKAQMKKPSVGTTLNVNLEMPRWFRIPVQVEQAMYSQKFRAKHYYHRPIDLVQGEHAIHTFIGESDNYDVTVSIGILEKDKKYMTSNGYVAVTFEARLKEDKAKGMPHRYIKIQSGSRNKRELVKNLPLMY